LDSLEVLAVEPAAPWVGSTIDPLRLPPGQRLPALDGDLDVLGSISMPQQRRPSVSAVMIEVPEPANWPYTTSRQLDVPVAMTTSRFFGFLPKRPRERSASPRILPDRGWRPAPLPLWNSETRNRHGVRRDWLRDDDFEVGLHRLADRLPILWQAAVRDGELTPGPHPDDPLELALRQRPSMAGMRVLLRRSDPPTVRQKIVDASPGAFAGVGGHDRLWWTTHRMRRPTPTTTPAAAPIVPPIKDPMT
jgi:hypothetical protein